MKFTRAGFICLVEGFTEWALERMKFYGDKPWDDKDREEYLGVRSFIYDIARGEYYGF